MLPRERTKFLHFPVTPTGVAPIAEKSIHWLLLNSTYNGVIRFALELVLHSAIVTDFAMERLSGKSHLFQSRNSHTDGACFRGKERNFFTSRSHQREWPPIAEKSIHRLLLNSPTMELSACLGAGSSLRNCDRLYHGKTTDPL